MAFAGKILRCAQDDKSGGMTREGGALVGKILRGAQDDNLLISAVILRAQPEGSVGRRGRHETIAVLEVAGKSQES